MPERSTSVVDSARVEASGLIWLMSGHTVAPAATPAALTALHARGSHPGPFRARHPAKYRDHAAHVRLPWHRGGADRTRRILHFRSAIPAGGAGLSRPCAVAAACFLESVPRVAYRN